MMYQACKLPAIVALTAAGLLGTVVLAQQGQNAGGGGPSTPVRPAPQKRTPEAVPRQQKLTGLDIDMKSQAVKEQLSLIIDAEFPNGVTLESLLKHIKQETTKAKPPGLPIYVSPIGLQEAKQGIEALVFVNLKQQPVSVILHNTLPPMGLSYLARDGFLIIDSRIGIVEARSEEMDRKLDRILKSLAWLEQAR